MSGIKGKIISLHIYIAVDFYVNISVKIVAAFIH